VPVLKDHNAKVKDAALSFIRGGTSLRKDGWAYNYYNDKTAELYDMNKDPEQFHNLADNPQYKNIRNAIHKQLETTLKKTSR
jgi:arylsulfatase A-like enzyme